MLWVANDLFLAMIKSRLAQPHDTTFPIATSLHLTCFKFPHWHAHSQRHPFMRLIAVNLPTDVPEDTSCFFIKKYVDTAPSRLGVRRELRLVSKPNTIL